MKNIRRFLQSINHAFPYVFLFLMYIINPLIFLKYVSGQSAFFFCTEAAGVLIVSVPAYELLRSLGSIHDLQHILLVFSDDNLSELIKIVLRREFEAKIKDATGSSTLALTADDIGPNSLELHGDLLGEQQLAWLFKHISASKPIQLSVIPPLMQASRAGRLRYLKRVWPENKLQMLSEV